MQQSESPIGVFDSGLGGLSIVASLREALPREAIIYFADSAYCPYGTRDEKTVLERSFHIASELTQRGCKLLVVACNTASSVALAQLRRRCALPIVGLEPAVKPAAYLSRTGRIAVLATPRTVSGERLRNLIGRHASGVEVDLVAAPMLVDLVERGDVQGSQVEAVLLKLLGPSLDRGCDVVVLGCTHFSFLKPALQRVVGNEVQLVDSGPAVARRTGELLVREKMARQGPGSFTLLTSGDLAVVSGIASRIVGVGGW